MSRKRKSIRGGNFFTRPKHETERKIENNCESECMKNARILCDNTCKKVAINSLNTTSNLINSKYIEDIIVDNKHIKETNQKLAYENKEIKRELDMIKKIYKIS
jgi:N-acetylmuramic acid 6-phosphate (MurNAc-6-P) etherase